MTWLQETFGFQKSNCLKSHTIYCNATASLLQTLAIFIVKCQVEDLCIFRPLKSAFSLSTFKINKSQPVFICHEILLKSRFFLSNHRVAEIPGERCAGRGYSASELRASWVSQCFRLCSLSLIVHWGATSSYCMAAAFLLRCLSNTVVRMLHFVQILMYSKL